MSSRIIGKIDLAMYGALSKEIEYLNSIPKNSEEYDEFGQGYWKNLSLYNSSGRHDDSQYKESKSCLPTSYIEYCPQIDEILRKNFNFDNLKMVRARNLVDGMVVPHRDFVEFQDSSKHYRVFLSIEKNFESYHSDDSGVFQMQRGEVWFLDAAIDHAAINFSTKSRMFLCLDFLLDPDVDREIIFNRDAIIDFSVKPTFRERKQISKYDIDKIIAHTSSLIDRSNFKDHLFSLSKFHFTYDVSVRENFDWLILATKNLEDKKLYKKATELKRYLLDQRELSERFIINEWN